jgi:predicted SAM-dependent methyltransferase
MMKKYLSIILMKIYRLLKNRIIFYNFKKNLKNANLENREVKLVIGSGNTSYKEWLLSDLPWFDILDLNKIKIFFPEKRISRILTEHVFEHLTSKEGIIAINNLKQILKRNSVIRLAVPDGFHSNKNYIDQVKPGSSNDIGHKELYNYKTIQKLFDDDFEIKFLEYFNENKEFVYNNWNNNIDEGFIKRSRFNDHRNDENNINYSSLIIEAVLKNSN